MSRIAFAVVVALVAAMDARGDDPAVKQAAYRATIDGARGAAIFQTEPFDLTYVPRPIADIQAITAFRPAAVFAHPAFRDTVRSANQEFTEMFKAVLGAEATGPGIEEIEWLIFCGHATTGYDPKKKEHPYSMQVGGSGLIVRTTRRYDWAAAVRKWAPCESAGHRGRKYLTTPYENIPIMQALMAKAHKEFDEKIEWNRLAFFIPDSRTLVIENEKYIRRLIDRLADGKTQAPPPGWDKVSRGIFAIAIDNRKKEWSKYLFANEEPTGAAKSHPGRKLFANASYLTVGLDVGPVSRLTLVGVAPDRFAAKQARLGCSGARQWFAALPDADASKKTPSEEAFAKLWKSFFLDGRMKPTPLGFEYVGAVREDLFRWIAPLAKHRSPPS